MRTKRGYKQRQHGERIMHMDEQTTNSNNHVVEMIIVGLINIIEIVENHQNI